ncbi:MAG: DUF3300 domain-containing protein, partial [Shewanella sp.]
STQSTSIPSKQPQQRQYQTREAQPRHIVQQKQGGEVKTRQNEPRQHAQTTRAVEHHQGRAPQNQERRHRE